MITVEEAVRLADHYGIVEATRAREIALAYLATAHPGMRGFEYGACFTAGIIEGIRRERTRRRKKPGAGNTLNSDQLATIKNLSRYAPMLETAIDDAMENPEQRLDILRAAYKLAGQFVQSVPDEAWPGEDWRDELEAMYQSERIMEATT